ncbi:TPA: DNA gyrase inhibitor YacG [Legionella pneumophila]|nr:DNA gyrase inhibitor YacG [Legionella pneumophila]HAT8182256.1 DNA gyrase inhibitor YacG [Legionella pneumophila]
MNNQQKIKCPICNKQNTWRPDNQFRPFCSERCKLIDLGEWASESRKIPGSSIDPESIVTTNNNQDNLDEQ